MVKSIPVRSVSGVMNLAGLFRVEYLKLVVLVLSNWQVNIHVVKISVLSKVSVAGATLVWQVCIHECTKNCISQCCRCLIFWAGLHTRFSVSSIGVNFWQVYVTL